MDLHTQKISDHYDQSAPQQELYLRKNWYYHLAIEKLCKFIIPQGSTILDLGCGNGDLINSLKPKSGIGIDLSSKQINIAKRKKTKIKFHSTSIENFSVNSKFEYILLTDLIGDLSDVQITFQKLHSFANSESRIVITYYNYLWEPFLKLAEKMGLKSSNPPQNWLPMKDIQNLLDLADIDVIKQGHFLLIPIYIPLLSDFINKYIARLPLIKHLCLVQYLVARIKPESNSKDYRVSIVIPARNEAGNIESAVRRTKTMGKWTELIFVEGNSSDNTKEKILQVIKKYKKRPITLINQGSGKGKGDAVRKGFAKAKGEILMILDADLTMPPEELPKFYQALSSRKAEFVMGSRLVYPMEDEAMRFLNILGNKFFSSVFSFLLDQQIKDTLCGTKVLFKSDYQKLVNNRKYFGDFDPFGDFDLIFGASKLNLKIMEIPIRYKARTYGSTNISRFRHGFLLLKMVLFASKKIKFI